MKKTIGIIFICILLCLCFAGCAKTGVRDGKYEISATLTGGTGRAKIEKATVDIQGDTILATIVWSSPYYEFMMIGDTKYEPIQSEGNAAFCIPVMLDTDMSVSAQTVAMSQPHLIDYTLRFDSKTLKEISE